MKMPKAEVFSKAKSLTLFDWIGMASAGVILGFTLSLALSGMIVFFTQGDVVRYGAKHQITMWSMGLFWLVTMAVSFVFRSGLKAWLWMGSANLLAYGLFFVGRELLG